jgi:hypothetical protein
MISKYLLESAIVGGCSVVPICGNQDAKIGVTAIDLPISAGALKIGSTDFGAQKRFVR